MREGEDRKLFLLSSIGSANFRKFSIRNSNQAMNKRNDRTSGHDERNARSNSLFRLSLKAWRSEVVDRCTICIASVSSFAAGSRGITCHKGSAKYITKLQRATKLEISFGSLKLDVAQIDRECPMACVTIPRIYISQFSI